MAVYLCFGFAGGDSILLSTGSSIAYHNSSQKRRVGRQDLPELPNLGQCLWAGIQQKPRMGRVWSESRLGPSRYHSSRSARLPKIHTSRLQTGAIPKNLGRGTSHLRFRPLFVAGFQHSCARVATVTTHPAPGNHRMTTSRQLMFRTPYTLRRGDLQ